MQNEILVPTPVNESRGAATLRDGLARSLGIEGHDTLVEQIDFWQDAIKGKYKKEKIEVSERGYSDTINTWYWKESQSRSYQAPNWRIPPERTFLFQKFRSDPNYHLKNLVEIVARNLVEEMLRSDGINASVTLTSDTDDVFSGVDLIVEIKTPDGIEYTGIDIAVSESPKYLAKKEERTETVCREFNAYMGHGHKTMLRQVFAIPPQVMARFLSSYMNQIAVNGSIESSEVLSLFNEAKNITATKVREATKSKVQNIIH